jgi:hypothetical protein
MATPRPSFYTVGNLITEAELLKAHLDHFRRAREGQNENVAALADQVDRHLHEVLEGLSTIRLALEA